MRKQFSSSAKNDGHTLCLCACMSVPGIIFIYGFIFFPDLAIGGTVLTVLSRAFTSCSFVSLYMYTAELFPTPLRQRAVGYTSGVSAVLTIAGPYMGGGLVGFCITYSSKMFICLLMPFYC